jgi:hypothetical protein
MTVRPDPTHNGLTRITGIGPQIAAHLRGAGIRTVDQLASATVEQIVAACEHDGRNVATSDRAHGWIAQAAKLKRPVAAARTAEPRVAARLRPQQTFTIEARVDGDPGRVTMTRVVNLQTKDEASWEGWSRVRLVDFLEAAIGVTEPGPVRARTRTRPSRVVTEPVPPEQTADTAPSKPAQSASVVHRFGVLDVGAHVMGRGETAARLRLDPADLDLPAGRTAQARVDLLARPFGAGRAEIIHSQLIDLVAGRAVDVVLRGPLPDRDPPFELFALVKILVDEPNGPPRKNLGSAALELAPAG